MTEITKTKVTWVKLARPNKKSKRLKVLGTITLGNERKQKNRGI